MLSEISDGFAMFRQFAFTGFWSIVLVGGLLYAKRFYALEGHWPYFVSVATMLVLLIVPNGWHAVFGTDHRDFVNLMEARQMLPSASLFKADAWGVFLGSLVGIIASFAIPTDRRW